MSRFKIPLLILGSFLLLLGAVWLTGVSPIAAVQALFKGSLGSSNAVSGTLREMTPLLIAGLAVFIGLQAGLFNIGVEGQLLAGAGAATCVGLAIPGWIGIVLALISGCVAGAIWAYPAGWIKAYRGGHEVITTIMLNEVAFRLTQYLTAGPLKQEGQQSATTATLSEGTRLGNVWSEPQVNLALLLALAILLGFGIWFKRTVAGFELRLTGAKARAAEFAGVNVKRVTARAMAVSGALGGLAGACQVLAFEGRFYANFSSGYGFEALGVALLAGGTPIGLIPSAFLFGALSKGSTALQVEGVPKGITGVVLGVLIIVYAVIRYRKQVRHD
ncbi:MAG: ABC transporter permease [Fimbriimonadaceae bacterium]|nr:ABC transporter permease [Fimbriimonadaceae bacterium]